MWNADPHGCRRGIAGRVGALNRKRVDASLSLPRSLRSKLQRTAGERPVGTRITVAETIGRFVTGLGDDTTFVVKSQMSVAETLTSIGTIL